MLLPEWLKECLWPKPRWVFGSPAAVGNMRHFLPPDMWTEEDKANFKLKFIKVSGRRILKTVEVPSNLLVGLGYSQEQIDSILDSYPEENK